jgi:hypothetical protein
VKVFRSQSYNQVNTVTYTVSDDRLISLYDTSGNLLDVYSLEQSAKITSLSAPLLQDDMMLAVLTSTDNLYTLKLQIADIYAEDQK